MMHLLLRCPKICQGKMGRRRGLFSAHSALKVSRNSLSLSTSPNSSPFQKPKLIFEVAMPEYTLSRNDVNAAKKDSLIEGISGVISKQLYMEGRVYGISVLYRRASMPVMDLSDWIIFNDISGDSTVTKRPKYCKPSNIDYVKAMGEVVWVA